MNNAERIFKNTSYNFNDSNFNKISKLLLIISDGRGIFSEGMDNVKQSVQKALQEDIFIVFIILDIPGKNSIFDIKMPLFFENEKVCKISI